MPGEILFVILPLTTCRLQDRECIDRGDLTVAAYVCRGVTFAAGCEKARSQCLRRLHCRRR